MDDYSPPPPPTEKTEKKEKMPTVMLYNLISDWVNHKSEYLPDVLKSHQMKKTFLALKQDLAEDMPTILEQYKDEGGRPIVRFSSLKSIAMEASKVLKQFGSTEYFELCTTMQQLEKALHHWAIQSTTNGGLPPAMVDYDDVRPAFYRLQYEPVETEVMLEWQCPTWAEIGSRMTNWNAFCMRFASIFDEWADRKQAVYVSGPKDSGKSQIEAILSHISGAEAPSGGGYTVLTPDQTKSPHWLEPLVGKRVVCISEAATGFLESNKFKSLTGDLRHMVNPKGKPIVNRPLPVIIFMFANEPPEISSKGELLERIIDCRITSPQLGEKGLIPDHLYQQMLKDELPAFIGYCKQLYEPYKSRRLPCEKESLELSADMKESYAIDYFLAHWILDEKEEVAGNLVLGRFRFDNIKSGWEQKNLVDIWLRKLKITKHRKKAGIVYRGFRFKTAHEIDTDREKINIYIDNEPYKRF